MRNSSYDSRHRVERAVRVRAYFWWFKPPRDINKSAYFVEQSVYFIHCMYVTKMISKYKLCNFNCTVKFCP